MTNWQTIDGEGGLTTEVLSCPKRNKSDLSVSDVITDREPL